MKTTIYYCLLLIAAVFSKADAQQQLEVFFDFNKFDLNPAAQAKLDEWLAANKEIEVTKIYGYCDWKGANGYNDTLSMKRVNQVYNYLISNKVLVAAGYETKGFGEDFIQSKVQSENRKVTISYIPKKPVTPVSVPKTAYQTLTEQVKSSKPGDLIKLENINFLNNSDAVVPKSKPVLAELLCIMEDNPKLQIEIQGHICCQTNGDVNDVSTKRAKAVYAYLVRNKINRERLSYKGYGITRPMHPVPEKSVQEEDDNRRVEILIVSN
ncbi:OmpA family protein [Flavobacterium sp.]|uniref:OmpA family protein n=1 Tax=Flavobacterium sp. TaxID=239 RepID=UPI00262A5C11|nr:OmpA family protein [Flavobacterium sp.]